MSFARPLARSSASRALLRSKRPQHTQFRFQSTTTQSTSTSTSHVVTGLASGATVVLLGYTYYSYSAAGKIASRMSSAQNEVDKYYKQAVSKFQQSAPDADKAIPFLKETAYYYASWVPGGRGYVDVVFKDLETVRKNHKDEVDQILSDTYKEVQGITKSGLSMESAQKLMNALQTFSTKIGSLAGDAFSEILDNHPQIKEKVGPNIDQLKSMGDQYGPEAKKQVEETWSQVSDIMKGGLGVETINKVRKLIEEKVEQVKKLGDEAWKKGLEQAKPYLDKNPKVKELVEKNADALKKGNAMELFQKVKSTVESGNTDELEKYVTGAVDKAKEAGSSASSGLVGMIPEQYLKMIPGGDQILPKLSQLKEVAEKHREEGEKLLKETVDDIKKLLNDKSKKAEDLVSKAKEDSK